MFVAKREILDTHQMVAVLSTTVKVPNEIDFQKLVGMIKYFNCTKRKYGTLSYDDLKVVKWYVDASFAVHLDLKSHTGAIITMVQGAMQSVYSKHKLNMSISTYAESVAVDDA